MNEPIEQHAKFSPSSAHRWIPCPGSIQLCAGIEDKPSEFADEGTAAHFLASECLSRGEAADVFIGKSIVIFQDDAVCWDGPPKDTARAVFTVDEDMAGYVQVFLDTIRDALAAAGEGAQLMVEQRLEFGPYIEQPDQFGTGDAIIIAPASGTIQVHDLKYGRGVQVYAEHNPQLMLYGLGALHEFGMLGDFDTVVLGIHQPRLDHIDMWTTDSNELENFAAVAAGAACEAMNEDAPLIPGDEQCRFCPAKSTCPALATAIEQAVFGDFADLNEPAQADGDRLARAMTMVDQVRAWAKAVEDAVKDRLHAGLEVPGFKLVAGRAGNREWADAERAQAVMKSQRVKKADMFVSKLITPTQAEKQFKKDKPAVWAKLEEHVTRGAPSIAVAPANDPRPEVGDVDDFIDLTGEAQ